jgi:hypothetical protein
MDNVNMKVPGIIPRIVRTLESIQTTLLGVPDITTSKPRKSIPQTLLTFFQITSVNVLHSESSKARATKVHSVNNTSLHTSKNTTTPTVTTVRTNPVVIMVVNMMSMVARATV